MKRLMNTLRIQCLLQYRHGFYAATFVILIPTIVLLSFLDTAVLGCLLPPVLVLVACVNGVFFAAGLFYYEGSENTCLAQAVTPLGNGEIVAGKAITLSTLTVVEGLAIVLATYDGAVNYIALIGALTMAAAMLTCFGIALAARHSSVSEFVIPAVFYSLILLWPMLHYLGVGTAWTVTAHPLQGIMELFMIATGQAVPAFTPALVLTPLWMIIAYFWATRQSHQWIRRFA